MLFSCKIYKICENGPQQGSLWEAKSGKITQKCYLDQTCLYLCIYICIIIIIFLIFYHIFLPPPLWDLYLSQARRRIMFKWSQVLPRPFFDILFPTCYVFRAYPSRKPETICLTIFRPCILGPLETFFLPLLGNTSPRGQ